MSVYAIKIWLSKSEKDWFLYKDLEDHVVHTWSRREKAEEVMNLLTCHKAEITEEIPAPALARSTEKKQKLTEKMVSNSKEKNIFLNDGLNDVIFETFLPSGIYLLTTKKNNEAVSTEKIFIQ